MAHHNTGRKVPKSLPAGLKQAARDDYVRGCEIDGVFVLPTIDTLADKHKLAVQTLYSWRKRGDWERERAEYQQAEVRSLVSKKSDKKQSDTVLFDERSLVLANGLMSLVAKQIKNMNADMEGGKPVKVNDMAGLATTLLNAQKVGKIATGANVEEVVGYVITPEFQEALESLQELHNARAGGHDSNESGVVIEGTSRAANPDR